MAESAAETPQAPVNDKLLAALQKEDPIDLARVASEEELRRLKAAEDVIEKRLERQRRSHFTSLAPALVGYVALAGFFANAYQNWTNQKTAEVRMHEEAERWSKEFKRAQDADKYRAFFETSALATDSSNPDKRLVGYALLKEFVDDKDYSAKAIFMLEESLALELRANTQYNGLDDQRHLAVEAILAALSHTSDCRALGQAARSIDKLAQKRPPHPPTASAPVEADNQETVEVFALFVRRLVGRAAQVCATGKDFRDVRRPIREVMQHVPAFSSPSGKPIKLSNADANLRIAEMLHNSCVDEGQSGVLTSDCVDLEKGYVRLCADLAKQHDYAEEAPACKVMKTP